MRKYLVSIFVVLMGLYLAPAPGKKMTDGNTITVTSPNPVVVYQTGKVVFTGGWKVFISGMEVLPVTYKYINSDLTEV